MPEYPQTNNVFLTSQMLKFVIVVLKKQNHMQLHNAWMFKTIITRRFQMKTKA